MKLFTIPVRLIIRGARVWCPLRGDSDVEECFRCPRLETVEGSSAEGRVICRASRALLDGELAERWWPHTGAR
jgi:hypothetical protein